MSKLAVIKRVLVLSFFFSLPTIVALLMSSSFTHTAWYYQTARSDHTLGLNYEFASHSWGVIKSNPMKDFNISFQEVEFDGPFGSTLRGWFVPAANGNSTLGVVAVHGAGLDRRGFLWLVPHLHKSNYNMLLFDCREHGVSSGSLKGFSFGIREHADIMSAVKFMKSSYSMRKVAVVATSQGAASTIVAASKDDNINAVWAENPFMSVDDLFDDLINGFLDAPPSWSDEEADAATHILITVGGWIPSWYRMYLKFVAITKIAYFAGETGVVNAIDCIHKLHQPLVLIHGTKDSLIPIRHSLKLFENAREPKQLWLADGCEHTAIYQKYPKEYAQRLTTFLRDSL